MYFRQCPLNSPSICKNAPRDRATVLADRVKRYGSALKQVISPMSEDPVEIPAFFETYENVCHAFEVPDDLKPKLLLPFLCKKARSFTARLSVVQLDDYEYVKDFIQNQFKLTPTQYKARFDQAEKRLTKLLLCSPHACEITFAITCAVVRQTTISSDFAS